MGAPPTVGRITVLVPPKVGGGDSDLDAHHDQQIGITLNADISIDRVPARQVVEGQVYMKAREANDDYTTVEGSKTVLIYTAPIGWRVVSVSPAVAMGRTLKVGSWGPIDCTPPLGEVVRSCTVWADHSGNDAGSYTRVQVTWSPLTVVIEEPEPDWLD